MYKIYSKPCDLEFRDIVAKDCFCNSFFNLCIFLPQECVVDGLTFFLHYKTPPLPVSLSDVSATSPLEVHNGFNLDGCITYRNISMDSIFDPLLYYPNPEVESYSPPGKGGKKYEKEDRLVIKVNLDLQLL